MKNKLTFYTFEHTRPEEGSKIILVSGQNIYIGIVVNKELSLLNKTYVLLDMYDQIIKFKNDDLWCYEKEFSLQVHFAKIGLDKTKLMKDIQNEISKCTYGAIEIPIGSAELEALDDSLCKELDRLIKLKARIRDDIKETREENSDWNLM